MIPYALIVDDFFVDFAAARAFAEGCKFQTHHNPHDGITYPCVAPVLDAPIASEGGKRLSMIVSSRIELHELVLRLSLAGVAQPYGAHSDTFMGGMFTAIAYLNLPRHCDGGTEFLRHIATGRDRSSSDQPLEPELMRDTNDPEDWRVELAVPMAANRVVIFPSDRIHRAAPIGGFGRDVRDGRLIMAAVFDLVAP